MLKLKVALSTVCLMAGASANAGVIDLGSMMGGANIYALQNFSASGSSVEGALIAGGKVELANYAVNGSNKDAYGANGYTVVAGKDLKLTGGSLSNGLVTAGGTMTLNGTVKPPVTSVSPVDFAASAAYYSALSTSLAAVGGTGSVAKLYSGVMVTGSGKGGVEVFNVASELFRTSSSWTLDKLTAGQTLIFNVSGSAASFNDGGISFDKLGAYNVLFNFFEATDLNLKGIIGSVLAPKASVSASSGAVTGQVVVNNWASGVAVKSDHYFKAVELASFRAGASDAVAAVPEPGTVALLLAGLGALAMTTRRRKAVQAAFTPIFERG